jgi:predicted O-methyltransferase YrrM
VSERLPANLSLLYDAFGKERIDNLFPGDTIAVGDVEFVCKYAPESTARRFFVVKPLELVERYRQLGAAAWRHATIVELGIAEGGSTALLALLAEPKKLIAVDIETEVLGALAEFVDDHGLHDVVRPFYGVNQADHEQLAEIVDRERGGAPLDLVIDDASHDYFLTKSSFETLFPRLRPGGVFVIEDWNSAHTMRDAVRAELRDASAPDHEERMRRFRASMQEQSPNDQPTVPLSRLAVELLLARASLGHVIASVTVDEYWLAIERGPALLSDDSFRLEQHYADHFGFLPALD